MSSIKRLIATTLIVLSLASVTSIKVSAEMTSPGIKSTTVYVNTLSSQEELEQYAKKFLWDTYKETLDIPIYYTEIEQKRIEQYTIT